MTRKLLSSVRQRGEVGKDRIEMTPQDSALARLTSAEDHREGLAGGREGLAAGREGLAAGRRDPADPQMVPYCKP